MDTYEISSDTLKRLFKRVAQTTRAAATSAATAWRDGAEEQDEATARAHVCASVVGGAAAGSAAASSGAPSVPASTLDSAPPEPAPAAGSGPTAPPENPQAQAMSTRALRNLLHEPCCLPEVDHLAPSARQAFTKLVDRLFAGEEHIVVFDASKDDVEQAYLAVRHNVPEAFWIEGCTLLSTSATSRTWVVKPHARCAPDEALRTLQEMERRAGPLLEALRALSTDEQRIQAAHHALILNAQYRDSDAPSEHTAEGALVHGEASCLGFALAYKYLLDRLNIPCAVVCGESIDPAHPEAEPTLHAWNLVGIKGAWTHVDVSSDAVLTHNVASPRVDFLGLTDFDMVSSRRWSDAVYPTALYPLDCYRRQGRYVRDWDELAGLLDLTLQRDGRCVFQMDDRMIAAEDVPEDAPASGERDAPGLPATMQHVYELAAQAVTVVLGEQRTLSATCNTPLRVVEVTLQ